MTTQFQYTRLAHQAEAVQSIADVFTDVHFYKAERSEVNPTIKPSEAHANLKSNITRIRDANKVTIGAVEVTTTATPALNLDVLMETGTGKTFTFIETMFKLHQLYGVAKFVVLVPSNAIRQGTLKSLATTAAFFAKEYNNEKINVFNYSNRAVEAFIHNGNAGISVLVATYQSFNKDKNTINKRGVEANLFSKAKSYMEALAAIRPAIIIDEPHRFVGAKTVEYLAKFNPLFTIRFGATFKGEDKKSDDDLKFKNLIYTLDSLEAFRQRLVKSITVDTVGFASAEAYALCYQETKGTAKERSANISYQTLDGKNTHASLVAKDNLGEKTGIHYLDGYVVESVTTKEVLFTNGFALPLGEASSYGMLADETQQYIIARAVANHFEREESLFKRGIKSLSLFFIDAVAKYMPEGTKPAVLRDWFETAYRAELAKTLVKPDLDDTYRQYLERTQDNIQAVHKGYFARSHSEKGEEEAIKLILEEKEKLLSFDTDLRFIFSMWALQEGWDNPNIFTLCKLAPSNSKITKLQQIGRGLRLAVNQELARVTTDDAAFDEINELVVIVPASEGDFVTSIQNEIAAHSVRRVAKVFDDAVLAEYGIAVSTRIANRILDSLAELGVIELDDVSGKGTLCIDRTTYHAKRDLILASISAIAGVTTDNAAKMQQYLDAYFDGYGQVKHKTNAPPPNLTVNPAQYAKFKHLWENLNRNAVLTYELDTDALIANITRKIESSFDVQPLGITVTTNKHVEQQNRIESTQSSFRATPHATLTLGEFVRELANATKLSYKTVVRIMRGMSAKKFAQIANNENRALTVLKDICIWCIYELIINKVSYELREVKIKTALTDTTGALLTSLSASLCGKELYSFANSAVQQRSLYQEAFMPVDSAPEKAVIDESNFEAITVFAKLPKINIPTPVGNYNPDFGYAVSRGKRNDLYLVVEAKGYDTENDLGRREKYKVDSAKHFFSALQASGVNVKYKTKLNGESLVELITSAENS